MKRIKKNPQMQARTGGQNKKGYKLNTKIIHKSKSELQVQFSSTFTKLIKLASEEKQSTPEECILRWVQQGLNRDYFNTRL